MNLYRLAFDQLRQQGSVYPCCCSRQDILRSASAPHAEDDEPTYPGTCRNGTTKETMHGKQVNWRFRVPDGKIITFADGNYGTQSSIAGKDFGDFVVWRHDNIPAYQLAVVIDDAAMQITEVVRGEDLLKSTFRQLLLYEALSLKLPAFYHCALVKDQTGKRLAKRHDAQSLRTLRNEGHNPANLRNEWADYI